MTEHLQAIASGKLEVYEATAFSNLEESKDRTLAMSAGDTFLAEAAVLQNAEAVLAQVLPIVLAGLSPEGRLKIKQWPP